MAKKIAPELDTRQVIECKHCSETFKQVYRNQKFCCRKCSSKWYTIQAESKKRAKIKQEMVEYKGGECVICGYNKCNRALEFHHINPNEKEFAICTYAHKKSWEEVIKELDKCVLVCANCHMELHENIVSL